MPSRPRTPRNGDDPLALDPVLAEKGRRWFAEARAHTKRDDEEIADWRRRRGSGEGDGSGGSWGESGSDGGDCGGGD